MKWLWLVVVAACGVGDPAGKGEPAPLPAPAPVTEAKPRPAKPATASSLQIKWLSVRDTPPCFYFSGPDGRDHKLQGAVTVDRAELADGDIAITIGGATFTGTYRDRMLAVKRVTEHTFGGPWTATEEIRGVFIDGTSALTGTYTYRECEHGNACPGHCTIDAEIRFER